MYDLVIRNGRLYDGSGDAPFDGAIVAREAVAAGAEIINFTHWLGALITNHEVIGTRDTPVRAVIDRAAGPFDTGAITNITPDIKPHYNMSWPRTMCFRDHVPIARDYFLVSHAPADRFGLYVIDRYGNRELLHLDPAQAAQHGMHVDRIAAGHADRARDHRLGQPAAADGVAGGDHRVEGRAAVLEFAIARVEGTPERGLDLGPHVRRQAGGLHRACAAVDRDGGRVRLAGLLPAGEGGQEQHAGEQRGATHDGTSLCEPGLCGQSAGRAEFRLEFQLNV